VKAIRPGARGPAVEDIQRRLRSLGYDLGPTGIDGAFQGRTLAAVEAFQSSRGLAEDGLVGDETWAALVDATFTPGDRMLYLRVPHFHGRDVREIQEALNVLGFAAGEVDGIFGMFTERAVREFQRNTGLHADGIAGVETVGALTNLKHVWEGKEGGAHTAAHTGPARDTSVLASRPVSLQPMGEFAADVAGRIVNLALAGTPEARIDLVVDGRPLSDDVFVRVCLVTRDEPAQPGLPIAHVDGADDAAFARLVTAFEAVGDVGGHEVVVELDPPGDDRERSAQRSAVVVLDAICSALV